MSDNRTKYVLGTTILSLAIVFAAVAALDYTETRMAAQSFVMGGHAVITAEHPDGSFQYIQTDNQIMDTGLNTVGVQMFGAGGTPFNFIWLSTENQGGTGSAIPAVNDILTVTGAITGAHSQAVDVAATTGSGCTVSITQTCEEIAGSVLINAAETTLTIDSVLLGNTNVIGTTQFLSWVDLSNAILATEGETTVNIKYFVKLGQP